MHDKITNTKGYKVKLTLSNPAVIGEYMYHAVSLKTSNFTYTSMPADFTFDKLC